MSKYYNERIKAANDKFNKANTRHYGFRFMLKRDGEVIKKLDSVENKTDYVRELIAKDIEENGI